MALSCASMQHLVAAAPQDSCRGFVFHHMSFVTFSGLKACPPIKQKLAAKQVSSTKYSCSLGIFCAAEVETLEKVQKIVATQLAVEPSTVTPSCKFSDLGADSLDTVEIVMALEEEYEISIEDEGAEKISTVQDAADLIQDILSRQAASP